MQFKFQSVESSFFITKIFKRNYVIILRLHLKNKFCDSASRFFSRDLLFIKQR